MTKRYIDFWGIALVSIVSVSMVSDVSMLAAQEGESPSDMRLNTESAATQNASADEDARLSGVAEETEADVLGAATPMDLPASVAIGLALGELQDLAVQSNPGLQRLQALIQASEGNAYQVGLKRNPTVGLDFQQLFSDGEAEQYGVAYGQTITRKEKLALNRSVASQETRRLRQTLAVQHQRILTDVHVAFLKALSGQREIDLALRQQTLATEAVELANRLFATQEIAKTDVMGADIELAAAKMRLRAAESRHASAWRSLQSLVGTDLPIQPLAGDLFAMPNVASYEEVLAELRARSPEVSVLAAAIERARCYLRRQQVEPLPDVELRGLFNWRDNGVDGQPNAGVAFAVPLPVHDRNQGAIQEARYQLVAAQRELEQLDRSLASRLAPVFARLDASRSQVEIFRDEMLPVSASTVDLVYESFESGEVAYAEYLKAQRVYAELSSSYVAALEEMHVAKAEIDGLLLSGSFD